MLPRRWRRLLGGCPGVPGAGLRVGWGINLVGAETLDLAGAAAPPHRWLLRPARARCLSLTALRVPDGGGLAYGQIQRSVGRASTGEAAVGGRRGVWDGADGSSGCCEGHGHVTGDDLEAPSRRPRLTSSSWGRALRGLWSWALPAARSRGWPATWPSVAASSWRYLGGVDSL
jgi:hypothetical protein